jgi:hypothetical protein
MREWADAEELGRRYQALALRIGRHVPEYVDFWIGPPELHEAIHGEPLATPLELHHEAVTLHEMVASRSAPDAPTVRRRTWLMSQLEAMSAQARRLGGEEIAYADLVEVLFDVPAAFTPDEDVDRAHEILNDVLPAGGSLRERLAAHDEATTVPGEAALAAVRAAAGRLRDRVRDALGVPEGEAVEIVGVRDRPWGASAPYLGGLRTRIEVNLDRQMTLATVVYLAAHEAYPGHHLERATKEAVLWREAELPEAAVACVLSPEIAISEGLAEHARDVVLDDSELAAELRRLVEELRLPVHPADAEREVFVARARDLLRDVTADAGLALRQHGLPEASVRDMLAERGLRNEQRVEDDLAIVRDPLWGPYAFAYTAARVVGPWLSAQGVVPGFRRLLREQLTPGQLRAELGEAPALFPGSLV